MMEELKGLTTEEIEEKTKQGKTNKIKIKANESILKIIRKIRNHDKLKKSLRLYNDYAFEYRKSV